MKQNSATVTAQKFVDALDQGDWNTVQSLLANDCTYSFRNEEIQGHKTIVDMYQSIGVWVDETFDHVCYESSVEVMGDNRMKLHFRDLLDHAGFHLDFRCQQIVTIEDGSKITHIQHIDIPGEPEKAARFNADCGVIKPKT